MIRRWPAVLLLVVVAAGAFWWWQNREDDEVSAREVLRTEQYCPYATRLEEGLAAAGVDGTVDPGQFFAHLGADAERVEQDAPGHLREDVSTVVGALRQARDGKTGQVQSPRFAEARGRLAAFQRESCVGGEPGTE